MVLFLEVSTETSSKVFLYCMCKEISSFAFGVNCTFKPLMVHFTAECRSSDSGKTSYGG